MTSPIRADRKKSFFFLITNISHPCLRRKTAVCTSWQSSHCNASPVRAGPTVNRPVSNPQPGSLSCRPRNCCHSGYASTRLVPAYYRSTEPVISLRCARTPSTNTSAVQGVFYYRQFKRSLRSSVYPAATVKLFSSLLPAKRLPDIKLVSSGTIEAQVDRRFVDGGIFLVRGRIMRCGI
jgi:hypothetical protein